MYLGRATNRLATLCAGLVVAGAITVAGQGARPSANKASVAQTVGKPSAGARGVQKTTGELMADPAASRPREHLYLKRELEIPGRRDRPQDPNALPVSRWPQKSAVSRRASADVPSAPNVVATTFDGVTGPNETGSFPPDSMGAVGPSQFIIFVNGRIRSFNKASGTADGVLNVNPDVFFASVMTPESSPALNFTSDPQIRYDRLSGRWILTIIDVPSSSDSSIGDIPNRILLAVSDAASGGVISAGTIWTFYFVQQDMVGRVTSSGEFLDYPSLGVDDNALYIGGNMFDAVSGSFTTTSAFVIRKSSILNGGPVVTTAFRGLITAGDGPDSPRGVDNYSPTANEGYFIGASDAAFGRLIMRRVSDPGGTPAISANIPVTVSSTSFPRTVAHFGNTSGNSGNLDALDDRLYAAHIRNGRLWTAHNIAVSSSGVASTAGTRRDGVRWYELDVPVGSGTPTVVQSGTVFDTATTVASARQYWIPTVMVSGQGHAALGFSTAGTSFRIDAATNGRLAGDTLGTLGAVSIYTSSSTAYNPPGDTGGSSGRRWGDYSFTSLDPNDDMTMWTIQEFCDGTNTYGLEVAKLLAPPPATPASATPSSILIGQASVDVVITGTSSSGSGFFDPGTGFASRLTGDVTGGVVVNSITYTDPTHVTLNLDTTAASAGLCDVTITNPDGQAVTGTGMITIPPALSLLSAASRLTHLGVGEFDLDLPLQNSVGIECRSGGDFGDYTMVFTFSNDLVSVDAASMPIGAGGVSGSEIGSNTHEYLVHLHNVTNAQIITVSLDNVVDVFGNSADASVSMGILLGDLNGNGSVSGSDVNLGKAQVGIDVTSDNFRADVNLTGAITGSDVNVIKAQVGTPFP